MEQAWVSLQDALENIVKVANLNNSFTVYTSLDCIHETDMSEKLKLCIYRIVQEQFNNIQKYASANNVTLSLNYNNQAIYLSIKDDGVGFDMSKKSDGVGLMNIKTRASLYNGKVTIHSSPGNGCEINIAFDVPAN